MAKQATTSSEPNSGLNQRMTRSQASRTLQDGPSERRRTRASSRLEKQDSQVTRNSGPSAPEQSVPAPSPRKRWFLAYIEIPPYPRTAPHPVPRRPTPEGTQPTARTEKRRLTRPTQDPSSPPLKRLRRSKRGRVERSPSPDEAQGPPLQVVATGSFDWWYESSLSPLTDIGSRPPSPAAVKGSLEAEVGLEVRGELLGVSSGGPALPPQATVDGTTVGKEALQAHPPINDQRQHPKDAADDGEISSLSSVPAEEGYLSDDQCLTEAQRGSPIYEELEGEPISSPTVTSINSPEIVAELLMPPILEGTPEDDEAFGGNTTEKPSQASTTSNMNISSERVAPNELSQATSSLPNEAINYDSVAVHPALLSIPPASTKPTGQYPMKSSLYDNGLDLAIPQGVRTAGCEFGGYSTPDPSSGGVTPFPLHPCNTGTSSDTTVDTLLSASSSRQNLLNMQPSAPPPLAVPYTPHADVSPTLLPSDHSFSYCNSQPIFLDNTYAFGKTQSPATTSQPTPGYHASNTSPHFTPPPSSIAFAPVIPHDWLPSQPPPHPAALPEIAARVMLQQQDPPTQPPSPPPQKPHPMAKRGKGKSARKTMKKEHYEFSSFSYYPIGGPSTSSSVPVASSSSTTTIPEPPLRPDSFTAPSDPTPTASIYAQESQGPSMSMNTEAANVQPSAPGFSSFVNLNASSFDTPGEEAQSFISASKYRLTGVRWV